MKRRKLFTTGMKIIFHYLPILLSRDNTHATIPVTSANSRSAQWWTVFERKLK